MSYCRSLNQLKSYPIMPGDWLYGRSAEFPSRIEGGVASMYEAGFTVTNFVRAEDLPECQRLGIKAIVADDSKNGWRKTRCITPDQIKNENDLLILDDMELDRRARDLVEASKPFGDTVLAYYVFDEPSVQHFPYLKRICDAIRRYDTEKLLFINLYPTYAKPQQLGVDAIFNPSVFTNRADDFAREKSEADTEKAYQTYLDEFWKIVQPADFVRYDNFAVIRMTGVDKQKDNEALSEYLLNLLMVKKFADEHGIAAWNACAGTQIRPHLNIPTPGNLALQAYTTLAAGYKGLAWFCYYKSKAVKDGLNNYHEAPIDTHNEDKTVTYYLTCEINRQVQLCGQYLMDMKNTKVYFRNVAQLKNSWLDDKVKGDVLKDVSSYEDAPLMTGEFEKSDGSRWFMVVNLDQTRAIPVKYTLADDFTSVQQVSLGSGKLLPVDIRYPSYLLPGSGLLCKVQ